MHSISMKIIILSILFMASTISCYGRGKTTRYIEAQKHLLSETDVSAIKNIPIDTLRHAYDSQKGTLYFAGLLWFLNDDIERAEIAWRRSARTGVLPWSMESLRLACYSMVRSQRYNQIPVLLDSLSNSSHIISTDPEVFSYYTLALWLGKNYEKLQEVLQQTPSFTPTLRSRVSQQQALFDYDLWTVLLKIRKNVELADALLYELFTKYALHYNNSEIQIFLSSIPRYTPELLSEQTAGLLSLRTKKLSIKEQFDVFMSLRPQAFQSPWIIMDTVALFRSLSSPHKKKVISLFQTIAHTTGDVFAKGIITLALADFEYQKNRFAISKNLYEKGKTLIGSSKNGALKHTVIQQFIKKTNWRYLYSVMHANHNNFFPAFISFTHNAKNPEYYSNLIEEYLSYLLQKKYTQAIIDQYEAFKDKLTHPSHKAKLLHWQSILSRIESTYETDFSLLGLATSYNSALLFDYFVNYQQDIPVYSFIETFAQNTVAPTETTDADKFINGFIDFGLLQYGHDVTIENAHALNTGSLYSMARALYKEGHAIHAFSIMRMSSQKNNSVVKDMDSLFMLYPTPYIDIIKEITSSPIEQALLMGIMREESAFNNTVVSHAGAIGLIQLLQKTALDIAKIKDYNQKFDLTNPKDNLVLGYHYYIYLVKILGTPLKAIASYNGGLGNMWKWETVYNTDNLILFADSLPFRETRNYVRKVTTSAILYGLLYFDVTPQQFLSYFLSAQ